MRESVEIVEVAPRDGLQNEAIVLSTEDKLDLIGRLVRAGARRVEAVSFVNPARVPQMADGNEVAAGLDLDAGIEYSGLVLNERGVDRAIGLGVRAVNVVVVCTDTFSRRNQGVDTAAAVDAWLRGAAKARAAGIRTTLTLAAAFGCPFEGEVPLERVREVLSAGLAGRPDEVAFADTIGVGVPPQVVERQRTVDALAPGVPLRWHFHNTRNTGYANAWAAVEAADPAVPLSLDASAGGIGGCPFAPNATGNIATEDLLYLLHRAGVSSGIDPGGIVSAAQFLEGRLGVRVPAQLGRAGSFPLGA